MPRGQHQALDARMADQRTAGACGVDAGEIAGLPRGDFAVLELVGDGGDVVDDILTPVLVDGDQVARGRQGHEAVAVAARVDFVLRPGVDLWGDDLLAAAGLGGLGAFAAVDFVGAGEVLGELDLGEERVGADRPRRTDCYACLLLSSPLILVYHTFHSLAVRSILDALHGSVGPDIHPLLLRQLSHARSELIGMHLGRRTRIAHLIIVLQSLGIQPVQIRWHASGPELAQRLLRPLLKTDMAILAVEIAILARSRSVLLPGHGRSAAGDMSSYTVDLPTMYRPVAPAFLTPMLVAQFFVQLVAQRDNTARVCPQAEEASCLARCATCNLRGFEKRDLPMMPPPIMTMFFLPSPLAAMVAYCRSVGARRGGAVRSQDRNIRHLSIDAVPLWLLGGMGEIITGERIVLLHRLEHEHRTQTARTKHGLSSTSLKNAMPAAHLDHHSPTLECNRLACALSNSLQPTVTLKPLLASRCFLCLPYSRK
ncbi:fad NAD binding oxidoreductase [Hortaea werneckii]|nr:fad NAD binding oxidoreductase [Hortaea werneckii]